MPRLALLAHVVYQKVNSLFSFLMDCRPNTKKTTISKVAPFIQDLSSYL